MAGWRDISLKRFGASLAGLALYIQLAVASWGMLAPSPQADPADPLGGHALCLAGEPAQPAQPNDGAPTAPAHSHDAFCCLWHAVPGIAPQAMAVPAPVAYAGVGHDQPAVAGIIPGPPSGPAQARAPPFLA